MPQPQELIDRINREVATPGFLADLTTWADRQCGRQLSIEGRCEPNKAADLVNAAIVATMDGVRRWDPAARTFRRHCEQTINSYLWNEYDKLRRRRHLALDTTSVDDSQDEAPSLDIEMSLRREDVRARPDGLFAQREVRAEVFHTLRSLTRPDDVGLRAFLDVYEAGHNREGEVVARLGLTERAFNAVVKRFHRLRAQLPEELRQSAMDVMTKDGGPAVASVARRAGRLVEIVADERANDPANESSEANAAIDWSSDDGGDSTDGVPESERDAA